MITARFLSYTGKQAVEIYQTLPFKVDADKEKVNKVIEAFQSYCIINNVV